MALKIPEKGRVAFEKLKSASADYRTLIAILSINSAVRNAYSSPDHPGLF
ncbi:hypothetical protein GGQ73_003241 [Rhizobium skierniewicense]|uniref:Uncharacterized protein n=1 Tax=Rhizobium skierniewicense TaxID=984260 RepID=A0A7W6C7R3_9HYPH|nr:hypothetical protein [Rhizobium skierniewicense]